MPYFAVPAYGPQNDVTLKMPAFEWVHVRSPISKGDDKFITTDYLQQCLKTGWPTSGDGKAFVLPLKGEEPTLFIWSMSGQLSWECVLASKKSLDKSNEITAIPELLSTCLN